MAAIVPRLALVLATVLFVADAALISVRQFAPMGRRAIVTALVAFALVSLALALQSFATASAADGPADPADAPVNPVD